MNPLSMPQVKVKFLIGSLSFNTRKSNDKTDVNRLPCTSQGTPTSSHHSMFLGIIFVIPLPPVSQDLPTRTPTLAMAPQSAPTRPLTLAPPSLTPTLHTMTGVATEPTPVRPLPCSLIRLRETTWSE